MRVTAHVKERFIERYRLFFYDFQLDNLDKFLPKLIAEKCTERGDWQYSAWFCNKKGMSPITDKIYLYKGKNCTINFIVKGDALVTCTDRVDLNMPSYKVQKELSSAKSST